MRTDLGGRGSLLTTAHRVVRQFVSRLLDVTREVIADHRSRQPVFFSPRTCFDGSGVESVQTDDEMQFVVGVGYFLQINKCKKTYQFKTPCKDNMITLDN